MSSKKGQNSILLLTTLGVYLGLLMAGATPGVIAQQAALTRNFDIQDEIEVKDDLDNDPEDCSENALDRATQLLNFDIVSNGILDFINDFDQLTKIGKTSWSENFEFEFHQKTTEGGIVSTWHSGHSGNRWAQLSASENVEGLVSSTCRGSDCAYYRYDHDLKTNAKVDKVTYRLDGNELLVQIEIEQQNDARAEELAKIFGEAFRIGTCSRIYSTPQQQLIYRNTSSSFSNGQVFIVTRLPRAGLDALLAKDAK